MQQEVYFYRTSLNIHYIHIQRQCKWGLTIYQRNNVSLQYYRITNKTPIARYGLYLLSCWAVGSHTLYSHKLYPIATVLGFSPELNGKTLILRTTHLTDRTWRNLASTTWMLHTYWLDYRVLLRFYASYQGRKVITSFTQL